MAQSVPVTVDGRVLRLSNLDKVLYPQAEFTKGAVIDYYAAVAPVLLPRLAGRPVTLRRYPNGADSPGFFAKNIAQGAPEWVRTVRLTSKHSERGVTDFVLVDELATLVWVANLAALELHVPQWTLGPENDRRPPDLLVFDLDPGRPATVVECCRVAELLRAELAGDGLTAWPKTSGGKGLQLYVPVAGGPADRTAGDTSRYAKALAERLAAAHPDLVVATMTRTVRAGRVLIDWSQNNPAKTTVAAYSLRAGPRPTVSTPLTWDEVHACRHAEDLVFTAPDVRARLDTHGDLLADLGR